MRVTSSMIYDQLLRSLQNGESDYGTLTERLATGKKILAPSDNVIGAMRAMDYRVAINHNGQYQRNVEGAQSRLNITNTVLESAYSLISKVKKLVTTTLNDVDPGLVPVLAQEAAHYRDFIMNMANTKIGDQYLFSGYRTNMPSYAAGTYDYQGDAGIINVSIADGAVLPINVVGTDAFSYTLTAASVKQISGGRNVHYTPGAGTTVNVEIRDAADIAVLDTFSFSNVMQMTDLVSASITSNNSTRIEALADPFDKAQSQIAATLADVGGRLSSLKDQSSLLLQVTNATKNALSAVEGADMAETAVLLQKTDITLQALRMSASKLFSQSLFDFLR